METMPLAAAERILAWAKEGLPILFVNHAEEIVANDEVLKVNNGAAIRTGSNNSEDEALLSITFLRAGFDRGQFCSVYAGSGNAGR